MLASVAVGCGRDGRERFPVRGTVTFEGKAVEIGEIRFVPIGEDDGLPRHSPEIAIQAGEYQMQTGGGLMPGRYRVEVEVLEETGKKTMVNMGTEMIEQPEYALISSPQYAGADSPLTYAAERGAAQRFDIEVPAE